MKKLVVALVILGLAAPSSFGATAKPVPKATAKATVSKKPLAKKTVAKKPVAKKTVAKKPVVKRKVYVRKRVKPTPSPKPVWPPKGYKENNGVFARVPSGAELVGLLSSKKTLAKTVAACEASACGAVYIASATDCAWWEVSATVFGPSYADVTSYIPFGNLRILLGGTSAHTVTPVFLVSTEPLIPNEDLILQTIGINKDKFYSLIASGQSLRQIAGTKINSVVSAITGAERKDIESRLAANTISEAQSLAELDELPARVSNELTSYNLNVGAINVKCWHSSPVESVPSAIYTPALSR